MATLTRKMLKAMGIEDEKIDQIIESHTEVLDEIKTERDELKSKVKDLDKIQKQLDEANEALSQKDGEDAYKAKYDELQKEYEAYKQSIEDGKVFASKEAKYSELLKKAGIIESKLGSVLKLSKEGVQKLELDDKGEVKDADKLVESLKSEWKDLIPTVTEQGANVSHPPINGGTGTTMTKEQIDAIKDPVARQKAMKENIDLYIQK